MCSLTTSFKTIKPNDYGQNEQMCMSIRGAHAMLSILTFLFLAVKYN